MTSDQLRQLARKRLTPDAGESQGDFLLNPDIRKRFDQSHDTSSTESPLSTVGAHEGPQGEGCSWLWVAAILISTALAIYFLA